MSEPLTPKWWGDLAERAIVYAAEDGDPLSAGEQALLLWLVHHQVAPKHRKTGYPFGVWFGSGRRLAKKVGRSDGAQRECRDKLEARGIIEIADIGELIALGLIAERYRNDRIVPYQLFPDAFKPLRAEVFRQLDEEDERRRGAEPTTSIGGSEIVAGSS